MEKLKNCEQCGAKYAPKRYQSARQKYCSRSCKDKRRWERQIENGDIRQRKGGYNRSTYIGKWMEARLSDNTAPCHYCKTRLSPNDFVLDHKVPMVKLTTKEQIIEESNLVVACRKCNQAKGSMDYEDFVEQFNAG